MKDVNKSITETRDMTAKVRGIVRNIEMISFQTNTLALNAAVEAARAGDAGRGFAVIANEIRELAGESNRAATDTSFLMNDVISKISVSAEQSQRAIASLTQILADGNTTAASVEKISDATNNQTSALE
jgi:methyl-accepting chemotaxis protein